jgi:hypothetical protein
MRAPDTVNQRKTKRAEANECLNVYFLSGDLKEPPLPGQVDDWLEPKQRGDPDGNTKARVQGNANGRQYRDDHSGEQIRNGGHNRIEG